MVMVDAHGFAGSAVQMRALRTSRSVIVSILARLYKVHELGAL
jgi:hypothetical protein